MTDDRSTPHAYTLFSQPWWLDAVAPGHWRAVEVRRGGHIVGRLPYVMRHKLGLTILDMPPLTQTLGPWVAASPGKYATTLAFQNEVLNELIEGLPPFDRFNQQFHHAVTNWLPFYWHGFRQTTRYTYMLGDLTEPSRIWLDFRENVRREIRKAAKHVRVHCDGDIGHLLAMNRLTFRRQGLALPYNPETLARLDRACEQRKCRRIFFAEDARGRIHAAISIVWDAESAYYLLGGSDPALRTSGAMSLLLWEAIQFAGTVTRRFDFEGSMIEPVERFFRAFGARQVPYFRVWKDSPRMTVAAGARDLGRYARRQIGSAAAAWWRLEARPLRWASSDRLRTKGDRTLRQIAEGHNRGAS